jgi:GAF domain-containing protein
MESVTSTVRAPAVAAAGGPDHLAGLAAARDVADVAAVVRTAARRLVGCDGATFVLRDGDDCFYADEDSIAPLWKGQRFPLTDCISGWAMLSGEVAAIPDIYEDARIPHAAYRSTFVTSLLMTPVGEPAPVAAIGMYWAEPHSPTDAEIAGARALAAAAARAIEAVGLHTAPWAPNFRSSGRA